MRRSLGAIILLAACCSSIPAADPTPEDAFKLLSKLKAKYRKDKKGDGVQNIDLARKKITDADLKTLSVLKGVKDINLSGPVQKTVGEKTIYEPKQITDEGLKHLAGWTELRELSLVGTNITDEGLKSLAEMKKLQRLILSDTKVTDEGMQHLTKLTALRDVFVFNTKVTDSGVGVLKRWKPEINVSR